MSELGKLLIFFGAILLVLGVILLVAPKIPWLGKLPGDITYQGKGKGFTFYFPLATCILLSVVLSLILYLFRK